MVLAEALLRVPDAATADRLIADKLSEGDFARHAVRAEAGLAPASAWALGLGARIVAPGDTAETILGGLVRRVGRPAVRNAALAAMRLTLGIHSRIEAPSPRCGQRSRTARSTSTAA